MADSTGIYAVAIRYAGALAVKEVLEQCRIFDIRRYFCGPRSCFASHKLDAPQTYLIMSYYLDTSRIHCAYNNLNLDINRITTHVPTTAVLRKHTKQHQLEQYSKKCRLLSAL